MKSEGKKKVLSRRSFIITAGLASGGVALGSAGILSSCNADQTMIKYACPYCTSEAYFETKKELSSHIHFVHSYNNSMGNPRWPVPFCITIGGVTGVGEKSAEDVLKEHLYEIEKRGWPPCTLEMPQEGILPESYVKTLGDTGYEMELDMGYLGTLDDMGEPYSRQLQIMNDAMEAIEQASGKKVLGARRSGSTRNTYTYPICEELGIKWFHLSNLHDYMQYQATAAYKHPDYNLAICRRPYLAYFNKDGDSCSGHYPCVCFRAEEAIFAGSCF